MDKLEFASKVAHIYFNEVESVLSEIQSFRAWSVAAQGALDYHEVPWAHSVVKKYGWDRAVKARGWKPSDRLSVPMFCREIYRSLGWKLHDTLRPVMKQVEARGDGRGAKRRVLTSVRKSVLVRDNATCQLCGFQWTLPLRAYKEIRRRLRLAMATDDKISDAQRMRYNKMYPYSIGPEIDHIIPATFGGPSEVWNLWTLCRRCNQRLAADLWPPAIRVALERLRELDPNKPLSLDQAYQPGSVPRG